MLHPPASSAVVGAADDTVTDFEVAFEQMAQGVVIFDANGISRRANAAAARILGRRLEDLHGPDAGSLDLVDVTGREIPMREHALARVLSSGVPVHDFIVGLTAADGSRQWLNANVVPIEKEGAVVGAIASFADVTTMRAVTETLQSSELIHQQLMEALADGVFVAQDFQFVFANPALTTLLGHTREGAAGLSFRQVIPPENYALWIDRYSKRIGHGPEPERRYETQLLHADGVTRIEVEVVATRTRYGDRPAVLGVVRDIRERLSLARELAEYREGLERLVGVRTAELSDALSALRDSEHNLRTSNVALADAEQFTRDIADNLPVRVAYWDRDLRCGFVNRGYAAWYRIPAEQMIGKTYAELFVDGDAPRRIALLRRALAGEGLETTRQQVDDRNEPSRSRVHLIPDRKQGEVRGVMVLAIDMTSQWKAQTALELLNEQLVSARDRAESAGRAKSAFLANMSHEMRTPMNAIIGLTHLLRRDITDAAPKERLARVSDAARKLLHMIDDALDLSKIEANKLVVEAAPFDVQEVLEGIRSSFEARARAKQLSLTVDSRGLPRHAIGDAARVSQALANLVDNAVKFTEQGSVDVVGSVVDSSDAGTLLRFEVRDTGIGIAHDKLGRIFTPFEQAESSANRRFGGSGLGLSLTRLLARLMDGDAGADSEPGKGSTFWMTVWVTGSDVVDVPTPTPTPVEDAAEFLRTVHAGAAVLVAEDNAINREVAESLLHAVGLSVDVAEDGREAIERFSRREYALVLMDLQMPVVDGLEATRAIRRLPRGDAVPIVAVTANAFAEDRDRVLEAGMNDHLGKPVDPSLLYATVARWLGAGKVAAPQSALQRIAAIEGLDVARGIAFFAGRQEPYLKALATFARLYGPDWQGFGPDDASARRELHSMGSACASVGASELATFAHELLGHGRGSAASGSKPSVPSQALESFSERLTRLSARIASELVA